MPFSAFSRPLHALAALICSARLPAPLTSCGTGGTAFFILEAPVQASDPNVLFTAASGRSVALLFSFMPQAHRSAAAANHVAAPRPALTNSWPGQTA